MSASGTKRTSERQQLISASLIGRLGSSAFVITISLKRSTLISSAIHKPPADYPI